MVALPHCVIDAPIPYSMAAVVLPLLAIHRGKDEERVIPSGEADLGCTLETLNED